MCRAASWAAIAVFAICLNAGTASAGTPVDLEVSVAASAPSIEGGEAVTFEIDLLNNAGLSAANVTIQLPTPPYTTFVSALMPAGWTSTTPAVGGTGNVSFTKVTVSPAETGSFSVGVTVNASAYEGTLIVGTATSFTGSQDTDPNDNIDSAVSVVAVCGSGIAVLTEPCDDGNAASGDGCSDVCRREPGYDCSGEPSVCVAICGDARLVGGEICDDGNAVAGDGCSDACQPEEGFACDGEPSDCAGICGDELLVGDEACDDGNTSGGDGCSPRCEIERGFACDGTPSTCTTRCGDGVVAGEETCDDSNDTTGDGCAACALETAAAATEEEDSGCAVVGSPSRRCSGTDVLLGLTAVAGLAAFRRQRMGARRASRFEWLALCGLMVLLAACTDDADGGTGGDGAASGASGGGGAGGGTAGTGGEGVGGYMGGDPTADCAGLLEPVAPRGASEIVGDGTPESCSEEALHDAVANLNAADGGTLTFACGGAHTIALTSSVYVTSSMIIDGGDEVTLSGSGSVRVIELDHYLDFVLQRITIADGFVAAGTADESGAGLLSPWFGTLRVIDVTFDNNHSDSVDHDVGGGAIYAGGLTEAIICGCVFSNNSGSTGGAVLSRSTNLRLINSVFYENTVTTYSDSGQYGNGGGLYIDRMWLDAPIDFVMCGSIFDSNHAKQHGSALFSYNLEGSGALVDRCTFKDNDMAGSPGGGTGSVYHEGVPLTLVGSTFSNNVTGAHAGGLFLGGGTDAAVENCTFVGNSTPGNAGALWAGDGQVQVTNCTFARNEADYGPVFFKGDSGAVTLKNVILADNTTANEFSALACHETFDDGGGNVQWPDQRNNGSPDTPCAAGVVFADPALQDLAQNGGPTDTMAISAGSPAIDVAPDCPEFDQRGMTRVGLCDAGAYEYQP